MNEPYICPRCGNKILLQALYNRNPLTLRCGICFLRLIYSPWDGYEDDYKEFLI